MSLNINVQELRVHKTIQGVEITVDIYRTEEGFEYDIHRNPDFHNGEQFDIQNSFTDVCNVLCIERTLEGWVDTEGKELREYIENEEDTFEQSKEVNEVSNTVIKTVHIDRDTFESEIPPLKLTPVTLTDETLLKQAEAIAELVSKKVEEKVLKVELFKDNSKSNKNSDTNESSNNEYNKPYTLEDFRKNIQGSNKDKAEELKRVLQIKGCLLLVSPPGEGKTTLARNLAYYITGYSNSEQVDMICFNSSTSYSDIIGGIRINEDGVWGLVDGTLKKLAKKASDNTDKPYILIIDEINRANTEAVLGEWMTAIEQRGKEVTTNTGEKLIIPKNLFIIGTMNSYDQSIKSLDAATIDRFAIYNLNRDDELDVTQIKKDRDEKLYSAMKIVQKYMKQINDILEKDPIKGKNNTIGNRVLYTDYETIEDLILVVKYDIKPKVNDKLVNIKESMQNKIKGYYNEDKEYENGYIDNIIKELEELKELRV